MKLTHFLKMEQNVRFFKSFARYSITFYVGQSVHLLVCPFISPFVALLVGDTFFFVFFFFAFTSDFNVTSPAQMFYSKSRHNPCLLFR